MAIILCRDAPVKGVVEFWALAESERSSALCGDLMLVPYCAQLALGVLRAWKWRLLKEDGARGGQL